MIGRNLLKHGFAETKHRVVFLRHGESEWNKENRFCGWTDVFLSAQGNSCIIQESEKLNKQGKHSSKTDIGLMSFTRPSSQEPFRHLTIWLMSWTVTTSPLQRTGDSTKDIMVLSKDSTNQKQLLSMENKRWRFGEEASTLLLLLWTNMTQDTLLTTSDIKTLTPNNYLQLKYTIYY